MAVWLAELGTRVTGERVSVRVAHLGHSVLVTTPTKLSPELVRLEHYQQPFVRWILTAKNGPAPGGVELFDYEAERTRNSRYYDRLKTMRQQGINLQKLSSDERNALQQQEPHVDWQVAAVINQMSAITAHNKAVLRWASCKAAYPELVTIIWAMTNGRPDALSQAMDLWQAMAKRHGLDQAPLLAATQVVNPEQGKGANRAKADALSIGGQESFWLLEYFKYLGLYHGALPRTVKGRNDRKTYVLIPAREGIATNWFRDIFRDFQKEFWSNSSIKMDIMAALHYTSLILKHWEGAKNSSGIRRKPSDYVEGFSVTSYKDLGSAVAVINVATIGLPDWIPWPETAEHAQQLQQTLREHLQIVNSLDEKKSEEERLLRSYREFMTSRDPTLRAFFAFTSGYASHTMRKLSKRQYVRRLSMTNVEDMVTTNDAIRPKKLRLIIETPGFKHIATAIRQATVSQQFYKSERNDTTYDIRYGLADELLRHSRDGREFLRALSDFLTDYSKENARVMERAKGKPYRKRISISTEDIAQLTDLIDSYDSQTIASMLIAFGYARDQRVEEPDAPTESEVDAIDGMEQDDRGETMDEPF